MDLSQKDNHSAKRDESTKKNGRLESWFTEYLPLVPIPLGLALVVALGVLDIQSVFDPPGLLLVLNMCFLSVLPFLVAYIAAKGYLSSGSISLLMLAAGCLSLGLGSILVGFIPLTKEGLNGVVFIHNSSALVSAVFQVLGAALALVGVPPQHDRPRKNLHVLSVCLCILLFEMLLMMTTLYDAAPLFFTQGSGPTPLRQTVLGGAIAMFLVGGFLFGVLYLRTGSRFIFWYCMGLFLIAEGLFCISIQKAVGSPIGWLGRGFQYLAGIYLLVAIVNARRELGVRGLTLKAGIATLFRHHLELLVEQRTEELGRANEELRHEIVERARVQEELRRAKEELEERVQERTWELATTVGQLQKEIATRKETEEGLRRTARALKALSDCNQALMHAREESFLLNEVCRIVVEIGGYPVAWIGSAEDDESKTVRPVARWGVKEGDVEKLTVSWADNERGHGPTGTAIRTGNISIWRNSFNDPITTSWREELTRYGVGSIISLPVVVEDQVICGITIAAKEPDAFDEEEVKLLAELSGDLAYGIETLRTRAARLEAEELLRQNEARYRSLFEQMGNAVAVYRAENEGEDFIFIDFNRAGEAIEQISREQLIGRSVLEMSPGVRDLGLFDVFQRVWRTGEPERHPVGIYGDERMEGWRENYVYKLPTGEIVAIYSDETDRKRTEEALRESEKKYRELVDNANSVIIRWKSDGTLIFFNEYAQVFFGYGADDAVGKHVSILVPEQDSAGGDLSCLVQDIVNHPERYLNIINENVCRDGRRVWMAWTNKAILDDEGQVSEILAVGSDITKIKKGEEALRQSEERNRFLAGVIENSSQPFGTGYSDGRLGIVNRAFCDLTGYSEEELRHIDWNVTLTPHEWRESEMQHLAELERTGKPVRYEKEYIRKDGTRVPIELLVHVVRGETGELVHFQAFVTDLTERKRAQEMLLRAKKDWEDIFHAIGHVTLIIDLEGTILSANQAATKALGKSEEEVIGKRCYQLFHRLDNHPDGCPLAKLRLTGEFTIEEMEVEALGGYYLVTCTPIVDESGSVQRVIHIATDITMRKQVEEVLRQSEGRYRALVENSFDGIFVQKGPKIIFANTCLHEMLGYEKGELEGLDHWVLYQPEYHEITRERAQARMRGEDVPAHYEVKLQRKNGSFLYGDINAKAVTVDGEPGIQVWVRDITERKRAEEALKEKDKQYRTLFEESMDGVYSVLRDGTITDANASFCKLFGYTREEMIGKDIHELYFDPADRPKFQEEIEKKGFVKDYEVKFRKRDETQIGCLLTSSVHFGQDASITGYRGILRDLTLRKGLQRQLLQAQKMEAIGTLSGGIAHDFNNILQVVLGFSEIILMGKRKGDPEYEDLQKVLGAGKKGADLVQRLLTFSRKTEINPRPLNLNHQIQRVEAILERTIPKIIKIDMILADELSAINADPTQVEQVLMNLAINARDAMPEGGRLILETSNVTLDEGYCNTHLGSKRGDYVLLTVSDTGKGMDKNTLEHIFEPFFSTKPEGKGTGLGLAMVYGIVKQHDGYVTCYSEPGVGTTFKLYFPVTERQEESIVQREERRLPGGSETILVVDDEDLVRELAKRILSRAGYSVLTAANGREALQTYEKKRQGISLIVLDLIMPEMDGKQCLRELLNINPGARVLIASGYSADGPTKEALQGGAKGFVSKPFVMGQLLQTVRKVMDGD